jgi:hypothetical protein
MPSPEKMRLVRKVTNETKREGVLDSILSFEYGVMGEGLLVAGVWVGFAGGGGEISLAGKVIGFLVLTMTGTYAFTKAKESINKAISAFKRVKEIPLFVGKQSLTE